jgi:hypothetical protein
MHRVMTLRIILAVVITMAAWGQATSGSVVLSQHSVPGVGGDWTQVGDGEFQVAFRMPPQWQVRSAQRWRDGEDPATTVSFVAPGADGYAVSLYYRLWRPPVGPNEAEIDRYLASRGALAARPLEQRRTSGGKATLARCSGVCEKLMFAAHRGQLAGERLGKQRLRRHAADGRQLRRKVRLLGPRRGTDSERASDTPSELQSGS